VASRIAYSHMSTTTVNSNSTSPTAAPRSLLKQNSVDGWLEVRRSGYYSDCRNSILGVVVLTLTPTFFSFLSTRSFKLVREGKMQRSGRFS